MCGRFTTDIDQDELMRWFGLQKTSSKYVAGLSFFPSQNIPVIIGNDPRVLKYFKWGLIPNWAKDPTMGCKLFNARAETLQEKPSFKNAFRNKRCIVPVSSFYEWKHEGTKKTPYELTLKNSAVFALGGLWDTWRQAEDNIFYTCTIITTPANSLIQKIHTRMPLIIDSKDYSSWLDPDIKQTALLKSLLTPYPAELMHAQPTAF